MASKFFTKMKDLATNKKYFRVQALAVLFVSAFFVSTGDTASAATYTANAAGKFNQDQIWTPEYPGNIIEEGDTVILKSNVDLNVDVVVKGSMIVGKDAKLTGGKYLIVLDNGLLVNQGMTLVEGITNRGLIYNKHIMETNSDMINTGKVYNNESMVVGKILDNTGMLSGNGGHLIANEKLVNSATGAIVGNIDVCSANFMNVDGARIDSTNMSFCGHRIFNEIYLTASIKKEHVILSLLNSENQKFAKYEIERSNDGQQFETVASLDGAEVNEPGMAFRYNDAHQSTDKVFYRMKVTGNDGSERVLPAVEVGTMISAR